MELSLNRKKLKLKHYLNIQKECSGYMTDEDYLYELVSALEQNEMLTEQFNSVFTKRNIKDFAPRTEETEEEMLNQKHLEKLYELTKLGYLECINDRGNPISTQFKLKKHPWQTNS